MGIFLTVPPVTTFSGLTQSPRPVTIRSKTPFPSARMGAPAAAEAQPVVSASDAPAAAIMGPGACKSITWKAGLLLLFCPQSQTFS